MKTVLDIERLGRTGAATPMEVAVVYLGAWTGRDAEAREKHIRELEEIGVQRPESVPEFYRVPVSSLTVDDRIEVVGPDTSGEVEVAVFFMDDGIWVGVGSDHTDRKVEAYSVPVSKRLCSKPIASTVWRYDEIVGHWDSLVVRSKVSRNGEQRLYQEGTLSEMVSLDDLTKSLCGGLQNVAEGTVLFCGTVPVIGEMVFADRMEVELVDPVLDRKIVHGYDIEQLDP